MELRFYKFLMYAVTVQVGSFLLTFHPIITYNINKEVAPYNIGFEEIVYDFIPWK